jgi:hypothetical protein
MEFHNLLIQANVLYVFYNNNIFQTTEYVTYVTVDGVRLCLWTVASNKPIVHYPGDIMSKVSHGGMILTGKPKNSEKTCPCATLSITNPKWTDPSWEASD